MQSTHESILSWLSATSQYYGEQDVGLRHIKRQRRQSISSIEDDGFALDQTDPFLSRTAAHDLSKGSLHSQLPSPPPTFVMVDNPDSPPKRPLENAVDLDPDSTPRSNRTGLLIQTAPISAPFVFSAGSPAASDTSSPSKRSQTSVSRTSSPSKQIKTAGLDVTGYAMKSFTRDKSGVPEALKALTKRLARIQDKDHIFPAHFREEFTEYEPKEWWFTKESPKNQDQGWKFPPHDFVYRTVDRAIECAIEQEGECSWNQDVHRPILDWVFRNPNDCQRMLDFRYCTSASIVPMFKTKNAPSKMVDYCVHFLPNAEEKAAITAQRRERPATSINHTDWGNLVGHPIAFSVETKRDGEGLATATAQLGTWHAAQWRSLLYGKQFFSQKITFLPALVVQGHMWFFVATTLDPTSSQANAYSKILVGSTETVIGAYQVLLSLKCLKDWAEDDYWPAYRSYILGLY